MNNNHEGRLHFHRQEVEQNYDNAQLDWRQASKSFSQEIRRRLENGETIEQIRQELSSSEQAMDEKGQVFDRAIDELDRLDELENA